MTKQNQLLAMEKTVAAAATNVLNAAYQTTEKPALFVGISRQYTPFDDAGDRLPDETTRVQQTVGNLVAQLRADQIRFLNLGYERDFTNTIAKADVVLPDGTVLVKDAPATYLLWLNHRLADFRTFVAKWPVLDQSEDWTLDEGLGYYRSSAVETSRAKKVLRAIVKYPATPEHPAQTETFTEDVPVGSWSRTLFSGAVTPTAKSQALARVDLVIAAVLKAREEANSTQVPTDISLPGEEILYFIFPPSS